MPDPQPIVIDLGMSDGEYLEQLAQGKDPLKVHRDRLYTAALVRYGIPEADAAKIAPSLDKLECSIAEKIQVNQALRHIWQRLTGQSPDKSTEG